jgi:hypothetical protein
LSSAEEDNNWFPYKDDAHAEEQRTGIEAMMLQPENPA